MIVIKLNCSKIPKERLFPGKSGKLIDLILKDNRDGTDQYGNDGFVAVSVSKEERAAGVNGEIVGNWKHIGQKPVAPPVRQSAPPPRAPAPADPDLDPDSDVPF